ncbi:MAG: DUF2207 domain-containing protein [Propionibacteriaceae bacterium]|jgi:uncharacterized membrane protein YgcG|nr:DUF2207 domain-containing protein [Propionibacteriaceae bacterium]
MRIPKFLALAAALLLGGLSALGLRSPALADTDRVFSRYDIEVSLNADGGADVTMYVDLDFTRSRGRGPVFTFITEMSVPDSNKYRNITYSNFSVSSPTGANTSVHYEYGDAVVTYQIGNENTFYRDVQSYVVRYTVYGLISPDNAQSGLDEFNWNAIGNQGDMTIKNPSVTITNSPVDVERAACYYGADYRTACQSSSSGRSATVSATELNPGEGLQIVAGYPAGTFQYTPSYGEYWSLAQVLTPTPLHTAGAGVLLLAGTSLFGLAKRKLGSDQVFLGQTPGNIPPDAHAVPTGPGAYDIVPVQFTPPRGVRVGEASVLQHGGSVAGLSTVAGVGSAAGFDMKAVSATLVDLAVRGYYVITSNGDKDWSLTRTDKPFNGYPYEKELMDVFRQDARGVTKSLKAELERPKSYEKIQHVGQQLNYHVVKNRHWFRGYPGATKALFTVFGIGLLILGVFAVSQVRAAGAGLWGAALALIGLVGVVMSFKVSNRSALGSAVNAQVEGFKEYLTTAEADQIKWEEGQDIFSEYLPWAIIFDCVERWTKVFATLAAQGVYTVTPYWYYGYGPRGLGSFQNFSEGLVAMSSSLQQMVSSATDYAHSGQSAAMSGGSGFGGGGFSGGGGGFGGGGSSSW